MIALTQRAQRRLLVLGALDRREVRMADAAQVLARPSPALSPRRTSGSFLSVITNAVGRSAPCAAMRTQRRGHSNPIRPHHG